MPKGKNSVVLELVSSWPVVRGFSLVRRRALTCQPLHLIQILFAQTEVTQDSCQGSLRDVFASVAWDRRERATFRVPPDFVRPWSLPNKLASQPAKLFDQYAIGHTGTRRSA